MSLFLDVIRKNPPRESRFDMGLSIFSFLLIFNFDHWLRYYHCDADQKWDSTVRFQMQQRIDLISPHPIYLLFVKYLAAYSSNTQTCWNVSNVSKKIISALWLARVFYTTVVVWNIMLALIMYFMRTCVLSVLNLFEKSRNIRNRLLVSLASRGDHTILSRKLWPNCDKIGPGEFSIWFKWGQRGNPIPP